MNASLLTESKIRNGKELECITISTFFCFEKMNFQNINKWLLSYLHAGGVQKRKTRS